MAHFAVSGLRDSTGGSGNNLGHDLECRAQWKINDNLEFDGGYVHWFKGSYFDRLPTSAGLPPGGNKDTDYFYILTKFRIYERPGIGISGLQVIFQFKHGVKDGSERECMSAHIDEDPIRKRDTF